MSTDHVPLYVVKIGSNVLADHHALLNRDVLRALVAQISALKNRGMHVVIVTSGAMAAGRGLLQPTNPDSDVTERQVLAAVGQAALMHEYTLAFREYGFLCAQVLTTKSDFRTREHYLNMKNCFAALLKDSVVPIVNENDVVSVQELMFTDNDELAGLLAAMLGADAVVLLSSIDGVCNGRPGDPGVEVIPSISEDSLEWKKHISKGKSSFGKGGMHTKCAIALKLASNGIRAYIARGNRPNVLVDIADGKDVGTQFVAKKQVSSLKRWVAHAEGTEKGVIRVNQKAADVLRGHGVVSLLLVGVTKITGDFSKGDIILIESDSGERIGLGASQYAADDARAAIGQKKKRPLVHYDQLYVYS